MKYTVALLSALALVQASPYPRPQGVTSAIAPKAPPPSGCMTDYSTSFGVVAQNITASAAGKASVTQLSDGQPQASTKASAPVSQISDGQPQASTGSVTKPAPAPVSQISDGQPQASTGAPKSTAAPITQISDGQPQASTGAAPKPAPISQISDGQPQAPTKTMPAVTQIGDGQIQAPTMAPITQIGDGQIQAPTAKPSTKSAVSQISDGQIQAPPASTKSAVSQLSDGQPQAPTKTASAASQISDGQPQAPKPTASAASQLSDGQPQAATSAKAAAPSGSAAPQMVACKGDGVLSLTLKGGILLDSQGRTGYIASNYQFQFDKPAQAGAIYTSGWSVCGNGSLALGGETTFYQCLSGGFYNLYNKNWAAQCNPVTIDVLNLVTCP